MEESDRMFIFSLILILCNFYFVHCFVYNRLIEMKNTIRVTRLTFRWQKRIESYVMVVCFCWFVYFIICCCFSLIDLKI